MKIFKLSSLIISLLLAFSAVSFGQETQIRVVDEVIAQVNDGVITLSRVNKEIKNIVDQEIAQGKSREDAEREINAKRGELIANMINEELILQRARELKLEGEVEAMLNRRQVEIMKQYDLKTLDALYKMMEQQGVNPQEIRDVWRRQATRDMVIQQEVHRSLYWEPTASKVKEYYEKNKARFTKPETVSISEIFLGYAGRDENAVREKAKKLVAELRGGADFAKISSENTDPGQVTQGTGKVEKLIVSELNEVIGVPLKDVKVGGYTEPIEVNDLGIIILRVDAREKATSESEFNENAVRNAMMQEGTPDAHKKFMSKLREDAYIKISEEYRPMVAPVLFADERSESTASK